MQVNTPQFSGLTLTKTSPKQTKTFAPFAQPTYEARFDDLGPGNVVFRSINNAKATDNERGLGLFNSDVRETARLLEAEENPNNAARLFRNLLQALVQSGELKSSDADGFLSEAVLPQRKP